MALIVKCNNSNVTDWYLELIGQALINNGERVLYTNSFDDVYSHDKEEIIVVARIIEAFRLLVRGYKKVIMWFQGIEPEESYLNHHSIIRFLILSIMEYIVISKTMFQVFVSYEMINHYEKKYKVSITENYYVMPCQNASIHPQAFEGNTKYSCNTFCYVGSMASWQCFDKIAKVYKEIEDNYDNCIFEVFTKEQGVAKSIIEECKINNYIIDYVDNADLPNRLSSIKYGFILRENIEVNRVSTPTKICSYLSCGVIPIFSTCLTDFSRIASNIKFAVPYDDDFHERFRILNSSCISSEEIFEEYSLLFDNYYNTNMHLDNLSHALATLI